MKKILNLLLIALFACQTALGASATSTYGTVTSDNSNGGTIAWTNTGNLAADDTLEAEAPLDALDVSEYLNLQNPGLSITAGSTIDGIGIYVDMTLGAGSSCRGDATHNLIRLLKAGTAVGDNKATGSVTATTFGGSSDLWGTTWSVAEVNATGFGTILEFEETDDDNCDVEIDYIELTVYYTEAGGSERRVTSFFII